MGAYYKYKRTYHLPWSLGSTSDDKFMEDIDSFVGKTLIISEKMDGENTNIYPDRIHARSIDSKDHDSRHWVKGLWGRIKSDIPEGWRICGENLYAKHSIYYEDLESYFQVFSIWNEQNVCLSWDETLSVCEMLGLKTVPVIGRVLFDEIYLKRLADEFDVDKKEGYVIRNEREFHYDNFSENVGKFVRTKHITTDQHWMFAAITPNGLKK